MVDGSWGKSPDKVYERKNRNPRTPKGSTKKYSDRTCSVCGDTFKPRSPRASLCKPCKTNQWVEDIMFGIDE